MNAITRIIPMAVAALTVGALAASPASARVKHVRHHVVVQSRTVGISSGAGQRPIYSGVDGREIGRANDPAIRDAVKNDDYFNHAR